MDLSVCTVGDIRLLRLPEHSQPLLHPVTQCKIGVDVYMNSLPCISQEDGFIDRDLDSILLKEGYRHVKVCALIANKLIAMCKHTFSSYLW